MGVVELDGIYTLQDKLLNTDSANFCIEKGLPVGTETPCFRTWQWTYMTSMENVLISKPKDTPFSCLSISTLDEVDHNYTFKANGSTFHPGGRHAPNYCFFTMRCVRCGIASEVVGSPSWRSV